MKVKKILTILSFAIMFLFAVFCGKFVFAKSSDFGAACDQVDHPENYEFFCNAENYGEVDLFDTVAKALNTVYLWVGIIAVIFIIVGGIYYSLSQGSPEKVKRAKILLLMPLSAW